MKRLLFIAMILLGLGTIGSAQTKQPTPKKVKVQQTTPKSTVKSTTTATVTPANTTAAVKTKTKMKKDGTPDKRYAANKTMTAHVKKDGTPDKRYKENKKKG